MRLFQIPCQDFLSAERLGPTLLCMPYVPVQNSWSLLLGEFPKATNVVDWFLICTTWLVCNAALVLTQGQPGSDDNACLAELSPYHKARAK